MPTLIKNPQNRLVWGKGLYVILLVLAIIMQHPQSLYADDPQPANETQPLTYTIYLPTISYEPPVTFVRTEAIDNAEFKVDSFRLWHIAENGGAGNGGAAGTPVECGKGHKVQIHLFGTQGDVGPQSRLNGVIIHVRHSDGKSQQEELKSTGLARYGEGLVEFELQKWAEVKVMTNVEGHLITSDRVKLSTDALGIPQSMLIKSGYCQDGADCERFVSANTCNGLFSWSIVFKQQEK